MHLKQKIFFIIFICFFLLNACCTTCPPRPVRFTKPCEDIIYYLRYNGVQVIQRGDTLRVILPADNFFYPATSDIKPWMRPILGEVGNLALCHCYAFMPIRVTGYTDNIGSIRQQKQLGLDRAKKVASFLWDRGIEMERIRVLTRGARGTLSSNARPSGEADNRRVEVTLP